MKKDSIIIQAKCMCQVVDKVKTLLKRKILIKIFFNLFYFILPYHNEKIVGK